MTETVSISQAGQHDIHQETFFRTILGFWIYLLTDCLLFGTLFTTYAVLHTQTFGGPSPKELFSLPLALVETLILLVSSVASGIAMLAACRSERNKSLAWLSLAFILGVAFVAIEFAEFREFYIQGNSWRLSAFLSSYFTLVGTHGLHVSVGLFWLAILMGQLVKKGFTIETFRRLACFTMFWHFLDVVWIFIFTFVYLIGVL